MKLINLDEIVGGDEILDQKRTRRKAQKTSFRFEKSEVVLAYFDSRLTNAILESMSSVIQAT